MVTTSSKAFLQMLKNVENYITGQISIATNLCFNIDHTRSDRG